jgi:hypothetical protein
MSRANIYFHIRWLRHLAKLYGSEKVMKDLLEYFTAFAIGESRFFLGKTSIISEISVG